MGGEAASKVAGSDIGAGVYGGLRDAAPAEQAVRKASVPVSAILSSSSSASAEVAPVQRPAWEPMPRVVFAGVPSCDEAKEATVELKEALDRVYLSSPKSSESREDANCDQLSLVSNPGLEINSHPIVNNSPSHALQAFKLLSTSTEAQDIVASIAFDPKVLNAAMQNPVVQEFLESNLLIPKKSEDSSDSSKAKPSGYWITGMLNNIKVKVVELVKKPVSSGLPPLAPVARTDNASDTGGSVLTSDNEPDTPSSSSRPVEQRSCSSSDPVILDMSSPLVELVTQLVSKGNDFAAGMRDVASGIIAREEELKSVLAGKDVEIAKLKAERDLAARKCLHFEAQFASASANKQYLLNQVKAKDDLIKDLQSALTTATSSSQSAAEHEKMAFEQRLKEKQCEAFRSGFSEGSRPVQDRTIKSPEDFEEQIGLYHYVDRSISTPAHLPSFESSLVGSLSFDPNSFFANQDLDQ